MDKTAADYEQLATHTADYKEAQIYATLAVAQAIEKVWDQLSYINRKLQSSG